MLNLDTDGPTITDVGHLPIVKHYAKSINLVGTIDAMVQNQMHTGAGLTVLAMVLDTLSGRNPLYRLQRFFAEKDTELLLGQSVDSATFAGHNVARVLDSIYDAGTGRIFSQPARNAVGAFALDTACAHYDTTSIGVFGDYDRLDPPFDITYGRSKDKRPDLKQFMVEMFCADRDVPIIGATRDGNSSDKILNNELLGSISKHMARHGIDPGAFIHVADSALIARDNLKRAAQNGIHFLSRLPATFNECTRAIEQADARQAAEQLAAHGRGSYHRIRTEVVQRPKFGRGRPAKNTQRTPVGYGYRIQAEIVPDAEAIAPLKLGAGCFVLLSNVPISFQGRQWTASDLLSRYKEQYGIEKNFGFLKDPVIVNSIFLKKNERIETPGMVLPISLPIWRLMERTMRRHIERNNQTIAGWDNRQTTRPTSFMMTTTKFINTLVLTVGDQRKLARPLRAEQIEFLAALKVSSEVFTFP